MTHTLPLALSAALMVSACELETEPQTMQSVVCEFHGKLYMHTGYVLLDKHGTSVWFPDSHGKMIADYSPGVPCRRMFTEDGQ